MENSMKNSQISMIVRITRWRLYTISVDEKIIHDRMKTLRVSDRPPMYGVD